MSRLFGTSIDVDELRKQPQFSLAMRLHGYWIDTSVRKVGSNSRAENNAIDAGVEDDTWTVSMVTMVTITRRYRSIIELCARDEAADGAVLFRSLYEAFLKLAFVVLPHLPLTAKRSTKGGRPRTNAAGMPVYHAANPTG